MNVLAHHLDEVDISARTKERVVNFYMMIQKLQQESHELSVANVTKKALEVSEYRLRLQEENLMEAHQRLESIEEFLSITYDFDSEEENEQDKSLLSFLTDWALVSDDECTDQNEPTDMVTLLTVHSAKGLEFPAVFLIEWKKGFCHTNTHWRMRKR